MSLRDIPSEGTVRGIVWTIKRVDNNHPALEKDAYSKERAYYGCCDKYGDYGEECTIYIRKGLSLQIAWMTVWHEFMHAIAYAFKPFDLKKEVPIEIMSGEIFSLCRQWKLL